MSSLGFGGRNVAGLCLATKSRSTRKLGPAIFRVPVPAPPARGGLAPALKKLD
jgi:hypothetical protein